MSIGRHCHHHHQQRGAPAPRLERFAILALASVAFITATGAVTPAGAQQPAGATLLAFDGVTVVDVEQGKLVPDQRVVIAGNRIRAVGSTGRVVVPKGAQVIAAQGKYLIPGLWDMHVHFQEYYPPEMDAELKSASVVETLLLANGVTGMRDAGSGIPLDTLRRWRQEIRAGTRVGPPRQILSGPFLEQGCEFWAAACVHHPDSAGVRRLVDSIKAAGADMIKVHGLSREMYLVAVAEARRVGIPVGGHTEKQAALEAADSGVAIIDHMIGLVSPCWQSMVVPIVPGSVEECRPVAERLRAKGTWLVPTIFVLAGNEAVQSSKDINDRFADRMREFWNDSLLRGNWLREPARAGSSRAGVPSDSLGVMHLVERVGLPVLAGSDASRVRDHGFALHAELAIYVAAGMTSRAALRAATLGPAEMLKATDSLGTVAPGKLADLVLLDADPLADITNTTMIRAVVANGRYYDRAALDRLLAEARATKAHELPEP